MHKTIKLLAIALIVCACKSPEASDPLSGRVIDLSHSYGDDTIFWPTAEGFKLETVAEGRTAAGYYYVAKKFSTAEHGGTHIDAPIHFAENKRTVDEIPLQQLIGPGIVIDVSAQCSKDADYRVQVADFTAWEQKHGMRVDDHIVLLRTGFGQYWPNAEKYLGTSERGAEAVPKLHFPGLHPEAAKWLVENRAIEAIGLDTASIDYGQSTEFKSHVILYEQNIPAFENVANLDQLPETGFTIVALPMKIEGGSGGPLRIIAILPESK